GKTATYVSKNGVLFENKIKAKESQNPKFVFLNSDDPYHQYYQYVLSYLQQYGNLPEIEQSENSTTAPIDLNKELAEKEPLIAPEPYKFIKTENNLLVYDEDRISYVDLKIIKLVAQFIVINGDKVRKEFEEYVLNDSKFSSQFQFLQPKHSLHSVFEKYLNVYDLLWNKKDDVLKLYQNEVDLKNFLNSCFNKAEYLEKESEDTSKIEEAKLLEKMQKESIDWDDFELAETIEFTDFDEVAELGRPFQKADLEYRSLVEKTKSLFDEMIEIDQTSDAEAEAETEAGIENEVEGDDDEDGVPTYTGDASSESDSEDKETNVQHDSDTKVTKLGPKGMKIRAAGESRSLKRKLESNNTDELIDPVTKERLLRCPITNQYIMESKFSNHISTLLRDPRYAEEKKKYESKFKYGTNLSTAQVYENIQKLFNNNNNNKRRS
ncbi:hypothetical protein CANINC_003965, partial [Pichia inconspicua]